MKVSVLMPVCNRAKNTKELLDNLTKQQRSYPDTEIIVVENGSTEDMSFLKDYDSIILKHEDQAGVYHAYNVALQTSTGDYIVMVENDDWIPDYYLRVIYENIGSGHDWYVWKWFSDSTPVRMEGLDIKHPLRLNWAMWGYCFSRKLLDGIVFNESMMTGDDIRVMHQIITEDTNGKFIDEFMYNFKWIGNDDSISHIYNRMHGQT